MPRVKLSNWYGDKAPGDEIDVDDATVKALRRDGRVADDVGYEEGAVLTPAVTEGVNDSGQPEQVETAPPETGRKRR